MIFQYLDAANTGRTFIGIPWETCHRKFLCWRAHISLEPPTTCPKSTSEVAFKPANVQPLPLSGVTCANFGTAAIRRIFIAHPTRWDQHSVQLRGNSLGKSIDERVSSYESSPWRIRFQRNISLGQFGVSTDRKEGPRQSSTPPTGAGTRDHIRRCPTATDGPPGRPSQVVSGTIRLQRRQVSGGHVSRVCLRHNMDPSRLRSERSITKTTDRFGARAGARYVSSAAERARFSETDETLVTRPQLPRKGTSAVRRKSTTVPISIPLWQSRSATPRCSRWCSDVGRRSRL